MRDMRSKSIRSVLIGVLATMLLTALACGLVGCGSSEGQSDSSQPGGASSDNTADMVIAVTLMQDVTSAEADDTPLQFSDEKIDVSALVGATALEVLQATGREIQTEGTGATEQVTGIGGLVNGDAGGKWIYKVNDEEQSDSPAAVVLTDGDTLTWVFVN